MDPMGKWPSTWVNALKHWKLVVQSTLLIGVITLLLNCGVWGPHLAEMSLSPVFTLEKQGITLKSMGVSKNWGTPTWMVYNGKPYSNG